MITFVCVDYRLIHGQVIYGWVAHLKIEHILVIDEKVSGDAFAAGMLKLGMPAGVGLKVIGPASIGEAVQTETVKKKNTMVLCGRPETALAYVSQVPTRSVNISNVQNTPGATMYSPGCFLNEAEKRAILEMADRGVAVWAQSTPADPNRIDLGKVLRAENR